MIIYIPVTFNGVVPVEVPDSVPEERRRNLAELKAMARVYACVEATRYADAHAIDDYPGEESEWYSAACHSPTGRWIQAACDTTIFDMIEQFVEPDDEGNRIVTPEFMDQLREKINAS